MNIQPGGSVSPSVLPPCHCLLGQLRTLLDDMSKVPGRASCMSISPRILHTTKGTAAQFIVTCKAVSGCHVPLKLYLSLKQKLESGT